MQSEGQGAAARRGLQDLRDRTKNFGLRVLTMLMLFPTP